MRNVQPNQELDALDKELMQVGKKFENAQTQPSRFGGLGHTGEHNKNYQSMQMLPSFK